MNIELFQEVLDYINEYPEQWDQSSWGSIGLSKSEFCGCFAGHLLLKGRSRPLDIDCTSMITGTAMALSISLEEAEFLTDKSRTLNDFEFFLANGSIINPANGRIEDAKGYDEFGYDEFGHDAEGYDAYGYDRDGYDTYGVDRDGYTRDVHVLKDTDLHRDGVE